MTDPPNHRAYQAGFREHIVALGWPVEVEVSARHCKELPKPEFEAAMDILATAQAAFSGAEAKIRATVNQKVVAGRAPARTSMARLQEELEERLAEVAREQNLLLASAAQFDQMSRTLAATGREVGTGEPAHRKGALAQRSALRFRQFEQRAAELRENRPDHEPEFGD